MYGIIMLLHVQTDKHTFFISSHGFVFSIFSQSFWIPFAVLSIAYIFHFTKYIIKANELINFFNLLAYYMDY